jgi:hypothetical protein
MSNYLTLAGEALARGDTEAARCHLERAEGCSARPASCARSAAPDPATAPMTPLNLNDVIAARPSSSSRGASSARSSQADLADPAPVVRGATAPGSSS